MKILVWAQSPSFQNLNRAINVLAQSHGELELIGTVGRGNVGFNGKPVPSIEKKDLSSINFDLIVANDPKTLDEARALGLDLDRIVLDRTILSPNFSLENYRWLRRSQLSILSLNDASSLIDPIGLPTINVSASDRDFLNFLREPNRLLDGELRSKLNVFNLLVVMRTEDRRVLEEFDRLPYAKKVCFVPFETDVRSGYSIYSDQIDYDLWDALLCGRKTPLPLKPGYHYATADGKLNFYNWWRLKYKPDELWLARFIRENVSTEATFNLFSVFGDHRLVRQSKLERKIFYTGENIFQWPWYAGYRDYCLGSVDLALFFDDVDAPNYFRFPPQLVSLFEPKLDWAAIEKFIDGLNAARSTRKYDCVLIARHDMTGVRSMIFNRLKDVIEIKCAGRWHNNTDELQTLYADDKRAYVHEFRFNICPENSNRFGYVTEKIFDAFRAGSIPIYYGSDNRPEPGFINPNAVLFFDPNGDNEELVREIRRLKTDETYCDKFMRQEKLFAKPTAEYVYSTFEALARKLRSML